MVDFLQLAQQSFEHFSNSDYKSAIQFFFLFLH